MHLDLMNVSTSRIHPTSTIVWFLFPVMGNEDFGLRINQWTKHALGVGCGSMSDPHCRRRSHVRSCSEPGRARLADKELAC